MSSIHPLALVSPSAMVGSEVTIGPFCVIEDGVSIGPGCRLASNVVIKDGTTIGESNTIHEGAILGGRPQHLHAMEQTGRLTIGSGNTIREHVTIHRALKGGQTTTIGDDNLLMVCVHVGHDCCIGNHTIIVNNVMLAGHVNVQDHAYLSGAVAVHQFCRVGAYAMVGGLARIKQDVLPFLTVDGESSKVVGLNSIGLWRNGFTREQIAQIKSAYRIIYRQNLRVEAIIAKLQDEFPSGPAAAFAPFLEMLERGFITDRRDVRPATLNVHRGEASRGDSTDSSRAA